MSFKWKCPWCNHDTTIVNENFQQNEITFTKENDAGERQLLVEWVVCPNAECNKYTLSQYLFKYDLVNGKWKQGEYIRHWNLIPDSDAKVFPDYVPKPIIQDYQEACSIKNLSPKASATLSRRCLQGMIRDFWGIKKGTLNEEIICIEDKVDPLIWKSIDAVRKIGNIGAHMEKDINIIIDVDPDEAHILIQLIEMLITEWYISKHERELKLRKIIAVSEEKTAAKKKG